jgi:hypothetical protein
MKATMVIGQVDKNATEKTGFLALRFAYVNDVSVFIDIRVQ